MRKAKNNPLEIPCYSAWMILHVLKSISQAAPATATFVDTVALATEPNLDVFATVVGPHTATSADAANGTGANLATADKLELQIAALWTIKYFLDGMDKPLWNSIRKLDRKMNRAGLPGWPVRCWSNLLAIRAPFVGIRFQPIGGDEAKQRHLAAQNLRIVNDLVMDSVQMETLGAAVRRLEMFRLELHTVLYAPSLPGDPAVLDEVDFSILRGLTSRTDGAAKIKDIVPTRGDGSVAPTDRTVVGDRIRLKLMPPGFVVRIGDEGSRNGVRITNLGRSKIPR